MCGAELKTLPEGAQRVAALLQTLGHPHPVRMLEHAAHTAQQAADVLGIQLGQVAKSIIFRHVASGRAVLVVTSGDLRIDEKRVAALVGPLARADADFVKAQTGFSIGGVSPFAHTHPPLALIDRELFRFDTVWAAAGHPNAVFPLSPHALVDLLAQSLGDPAAAPVSDVVKVNVPS